MKTRKVGLFGDTHVGHQLGLFPPSYTTIQTSGAGTLKTPNEYQSLLLEGWNYWVSCLNDEKVDEVVFMGDLIQGQAHYNNPHEIVLGQAQDQAQAAAILFKQIKARKKYLLKGTGSHVDDDGNPIEWDVANAINATPVYGNLVNMELELEVDPKHFIHLTHHIGTVSMREWTRGYPLNREITEAEIINGRRDDGKHCVGIGRAHCHSYGLFDNGEATAFTTPPFQIPTDFVLKHSSMARQIIQVGGVIIEIADGEFTVKKRLFQIKLFDLTPRV
jgi:hypothetical protein